MRLGRLVYGSLAIGLIAALLWVALWSIAYPGVWDGYDAHTWRVFLLGSVAYAVPQVALALFGRRHRRR